MQALQKLTLSADLKQNDELSHDLNRAAICFLGLPFDAIDMNALKHAVVTSASSRTPLFLSTPNLNFLLEAQQDADFRKSVLSSHISVVDGHILPRLIKLIHGNEISHNSGSDLFDELLKLSPQQQISVFYFGGDEGVAKQAYEVTQSREDSGVTSVGYLNPGWGDVKLLSDPKILEEINKSKCDFLVVSLGAKKGQEWILKNREKLSVPVISHLGAVLGFTAGTIKRAPKGLQKMGLEWFWRIKEQPQLYKRYFQDGTTLIRMFFTNILPYKKICQQAKELNVQSIDGHNTNINYAETLNESSDQVEIKFSGIILKENCSLLNEVFFNSRNRSSITLCFQEVPYMDEYGLGKLLIASKHFGPKLRIENLGPFLAQIQQFEPWLKNH